jgi:selenocysteine-specific elongation factor
MRPAIELTETTETAAAMQVVATAGHVDHGKSALLRRLTGMEPDRWAEERRRGLTIDLGYVWTELPRPDADPLTVAFVDVPGHDSFLPNMLCGVGVVDQVLFVVAADDGWSAQSEEHLEILDLLERRAVAAVVTKADLAGPGRTSEVVSDVARRLEATSLHDAPVLAVDSLSGTGIDALRACLVDRLGAGHDRSADQLEDRGTAGDGPDATRLWIDRVFTAKGAGTVATGMLAAGALEPGQDVEVAPRGLTGRVRGLQCLGRTVTAAVRGSRVAVNLAGVDHDAFGRGDVLIASGRSGSKTRRTSTAIDVRLRALPHSTIGRSGAWHLHVGTATTTVQVLPLLGDLEPGTSAPVRLELTDPLPLRAGDRFVLREAGRRRTAGGGVVLDPLPAERRRGTERRLGHALVLEDLADAADATARLVGLVDAHDGRRDLGELRAMFGATAEGLVRDAGLAVIAGQVVRRDLLQRWRTNILATAEAAPADHAVELARLTAAAADAGCPRRLAAALVEHAVRDGGLHSHGGRFVHRDREDAYLASRASRRDAFLTRLATSAHEPPDPTVLAQDVAIPSFEVQELIDDGELVACGPLLFTPDAVTEAAQALRHGPGRGGAPFTASEARQAWGTSRRCAMPLLDHLRGVGITTFDGTHHRLVAPDGPDGPGERDGPTAPNPPDARQPSSDDTAPPDRT